MCRQFSLASLLVLFLSLSAGATPTDVPLYSISAKALGLPFEMDVSEVRRTASKSYLDVPGFGERTAVQSRWLMCVYTDLALERGFSHWTVVYPTQNGTRLVVGFSNSAKTSPSTLLGADFAPDRTIGAEMTAVAPYARFCGFKPEARGRA